MKLLETKHFDGSIADYFLDEVNNTVLEVKTLSDGTTKNYIHTIEEYNERHKANLTTTSSNGKERTLNQYRQSKDAVYNQG